MVIDLDAVQLMDCSPALGEAVLSRTGEASKGPSECHLHSRVQQDIQALRNYCLCPCCCALSMILYCWGVVQRLFAWQ